VNVASALSGEFAGAPVVRVDALPSLPGRFWAWTVVIETAQSYFICDVGLRNWLDHPPQFESYEKRLDDPLYQAALARPEMTHFARFARYPFVTVDKSHDRIRVFLRDLRYARSEIEGWGVVMVTMPMGSDRSYPQDF
jgi:hypothetical protein